MRLAGEHGFALVLAAGQIMQGAAVAARGQGTAGLKQIQGGLDAYRASGAVFQRSYHLALLAEVLRAEGSQEEGLEALQEAVDLVETSGERFYEAEIHRLKGELLLAAPAEASTAAEACFHKAIEIARAQKARSWELRAATSLARLWQRPGQAGRGPRPAGAGLRLVHRRLRHRRPQGRQGAARRAAIEFRCCLLLAQAGPRGTGARRRPARPLSG